MSWPPPRLWSSYTLLFLLSKWGQDYDGEIPIPSPQHPPSLSLKSTSQYQIAGRETGEGALRVWSWVLAPAGKPSTQCPWLLLGCPNQTSPTKARRGVSWLSLCLLHLHTHDQVSACPNPQRVLAIPFPELGPSDQTGLGEGPTTSSFQHQGCQLPRETGTHEAPLPAPISIQKLLEWA